MENGFINDILLSPEEELEIDLLVKRCKGACELGQKLHRLYGKYLRMKEVIKQIDEETWRKIKSKH